MINHNSQEPPKPVVFWVIWFGILSGLFIIDNFAAPKADPDAIVSGEASLIYPAFSIVVATISLAIRFLVIPRLKALQPKLVAMVIGLAVAEASGMLGMFVVRPEFESTRIFMLATAIVCIVLHAPIYTRKTPEPHKS